MSLTWKIILPLAAIVIVGAAVGAYKNRSLDESNKSESQQTTTTEERSYDPNAKPITDADINLLLKDVGAESPANAEEETDSAVVTSDKQELNNFDNVYVPTDF